MAAGEKRGEAWIEPWWAPTFSVSEEETESPATGLIRRRKQGRKETRIVFQRSKKDRGSRRTE